jgi:putative dehydrogenase
MVREVTGPVGVIGLGSMGTGTALAMKDAGLDVVGFDVSAEARQKFLESGGRVADNPGEVARHCAIVLTVVVNSRQVDAALFGPGGVVELMPRGGLVVQCATVAPSYARDLGERLAVAGIGLLDAPISGGAAKARQGQLSVMASGSAACFRQAAAVLDAMAGKVYRLGDAPGVGSSVKLVNQHLAGIHIAAAAEAMALGIRMGLDPDMLYEVISNSAGNSWMFDNRVPHILKGDYTPFSAVDIFVKDLGIVNSTGCELTLPLPVATTALQQFIAASAAGHGREDDAAVIKVYQHLAGLKLPGTDND